jgi:hypothetical protein
MVTWLHIEATSKSDDAGVYLAALSFSEEVGLSTIPTPLVFDPLGNVYLPTEALVVCTR